MPLRSPTVNQVQRTTHHAFAVAAMLTIGLLVVSMLFGIATDRPKVIYMSAATLAFLIPAMTGLSRGDRFDLFEPINLAAATVLFGTTIRAIYLIFWSTQRADALMLYQSFRDVNREVIWVLIGLICFSLGYLVPWRLRLERIGMIRRYRPDRRGFWLAITIMASAGLIGTVFFMARFNIDLSDLASSSKHAAEYITEDGKVVYGAGWETLLGQFAQYGLLVFVGTWLAGAFHLDMRYLVIGTILLLLSTLVPYLNSLRTPLIIIFVSCCATGYYYNRIGTKLIVVTVMAVLALVAVLGALRNANNDTSSNRGFVDTVVGSGNGFDTVRTTAIITRVRDRQLFQNGQSYAALATSFVPRQLWPQKPPTAMGAWVKKELFGQRVRNAGWPPGLVAEAYANFGYVGIPIMMFLIGALIGLAYQSCKPLLGVSLPVTVIYAMCFYGLGFNILALNFVQGVIGVIINVIFLCITFWIARLGGLRPKKATNSRHRSETSIAT